MVNGKIHVGTTIDTGMRWLTDHAPVQLTVSKILGRDGDNTMVLLTDNYCGNRGRYLISDNGCVYMNGFEAGTYYPTNYKLL